MYVTKIFLTLRLKIEEMGLRYGVVKRTGNEYSIAKKLWIPTEYAWLYVELPSKSVIKIKSIKGFSKDGHPLFARKKYYVYGWVDNLEIELNSETIVVDGFYELLECKTQSQVEKWLDENIWCDLQNADNNIEALVRNRYKESEN